MGTLKLAAVPPVRAPSAALSAGEIIEDGETGARYRITGFIGKGGMGEVYKGEAEATGKIVAIKTIPLALADDPTIALRTQFESSILRQLHHRNVVRVHASGVRHDGVIFMVMDYLRGMTLRELRQAKGRIPIAWSLEMMRDVCRGLVMVHDHAIHRDIKPANLHFGADAIIRVLDLGAAKWRRSGMKLTTTGTQLGTPAYMAPEQLDESAPVDVPADIWAIGVVLYELVADRHPFAFEGRLPDSPFVLGNRILDEPHVPLRDVAPLFPDDLAWVIDKALAKDPRARHRSAWDFSSAISHVLRAFSEKHGALPPLDDLGAQLFAGGGQRPGVTQSGRPAVVPAPPHLQSTAPLDKTAASAQPTALPYMRTDEIPSSIVAAAMSGAPREEREPPRVSDVFLKQTPATPEPPVQEAFPAAPMSATVQEAPAMAAAPAEQRGVPRIAFVAAGTLAIVGVTAAALAIAEWADAKAPATAPTARAQAPSASPAPPPRLPSARPSPPRPGH